MELEPSSSSVVHVRTQRRGREEKGRENQVENGEAEETGADSEEVKQR